MKLAEALILRSDLQKRIEQIKSRLQQNVLIQEGDTPSEDPNTLLKEFSTLQNDLTKIIKAINKTNSQTMLDEKKHLADALVERDALLAKRNMLSDIAEAASQKQARYSRSEIKYISTVDVKKIQKEIDKLSKAYRELDTAIQAMNWQIDLL
ncbi:DIP1984 family protein [Streptococcus pacificus]|uniref:DIP1984 family protein n=1 Tax=Streptococcus pacificus TaxID=2740577 RepID=A0ABS0ZJU4_9STRE|nr:DIP1984 family protein [Streptococcus pacificus]MBJ8326237.1 DIP1984 family protein [Streptococcus pacificus]